MSCRSKEIQSLSQWDIKLTLEEEISKFEECPSVRGEGCYQLRGKDGKTYAHLLRGRFTFYCFAYTCGEFLYLRNVVTCCIQRPNDHVSGFECVTNIVVTTM